MPTWTGNQYFTFRDYEDIPVLDQYEGEGIDDSEQV